MNIDLKDLPDLLKPFIAGALDDGLGKLPAILGEAAARGGMPDGGMLVAKLAESLVEFARPYVADGLGALADELSLSITDAMKAIHGDDYPAVVTVHSVKSDPGIIDQE